MKNDFSDINIITTTTGKDRLPFLFATMMAILPNISKARWDVIFDMSAADGYAESKQSSMKDIIKRIAKLTENEVNFIYAESSYDKNSIAYYKAKCIKGHYGETIEFNSGGVYKKWLLNIDDDFILPERTLDKIANLTVSNKGEYFSLCQFDIYNMRGWEDWDDTRRETSQMEAFKLKFGKEKIVSHLWEEDEFPVRLEYTGAASGCFLVNIAALYAKGILETMEKFARGERMYDVMISKRFVPAVTVVGATVYHIGVYENYFNEKWDKDRYVAKFRKGFEMEYKQEFDKPIKD